MAQNNSLNKSSEDFTVDNLYINGNSITSTSGVVTIQPLAGQNIELTADTVDHTYSNIGAEVISQVVNSDNTSTDSNSALIIKTGGASGGDPYLKWSTTAGSYVFGIDNSDSDILKLGLNGNDPSDTTEYFRLNANGASQFTAATLTHTLATAGTACTFINSQTDNTNAASHSTLQIRSGGASGGDAYVRYAIEGVLEYSWGIDNTDSDSLVLTNAATLNGTNFWRMTTAGERTLPLQPAVLAEVTSSINNVTGNGTTYTIIFGSARFDQNNDFNTGTGVFTAPVTGKYSLICQCETDQVSGGSSFQLNLITSNRNYLNAQAVTPAASYNQSVSALGDMDAADTAYCTVRVNGVGADTSDVLGGQYTRFCINLAC